MYEIRSLSLFTGAGGGALGEQLHGWRHVGYVEFNDYCQRVIRQRIKDGILDEAPIFGDIRDIDKGIIDSLSTYWYNSLSIEREDNDMPAHRKNYDNAVSLYNQGLSIQEVADFYFITRQAMYVALKRRGVVFRGNLKYGEENHFWRGTKANDRAQNLVERAIEKGILKRKDKCEDCGSSGTFKDKRTSIQAHHDDYNKPLEIRWLCQKCHHQWHKNNKAKAIEEVKVEPGKVIDVVTAGFP